MPSPPDPAAAYTRALHAYTEGGGEAALADAYELGRSVLSAGAGVLEIAEIHHRALRALAEDGDAVQRERRMAAAGRFLLEALSPFEMMLRGFRESNVALRGINEQLEAETRRLAHALHDEAGQLLAAVYIALDGAVGRLPAAQRPPFAGVRELLAGVEEQVRRLSHELRPTILDDLGLRPALEFLAEGVAQRYGISIAVTGTTGNRLPPALETALYRAVQEALNNVAKHAAASRVLIDLHRNTDKLECTVRDDGAGFDPACSDGRQGLGLAGMRERLHSVGGELVIHSAPGSGTELRISAPLPE
ncbi:MAG: ATP-binding protein [Terriglobales bacterium]